MFFNIAEALGGVGQQSEIVHCTIPNYLTAKAVYLK
jgi:hypothetical protein